MSEPTNAEIQKEHDEVATSHERTFEDGELAHYHRGILLKRLVAEATEKTFPEAGLNWIDKYINQKEQSQ